MTATTQSSKRKLSLQQLAEELGVPIQAVLTDNGR